MKVMKKIAIAVLVLALFACASATISRPSSRIAEAKARAAGFLARKLKSQGSFAVQTATVDLSTSGLLRTPEDQGSCGSCTAFATTHTVQDSFRLCAEPVSHQALLSEQDIVDCLPILNYCSNGAENTDVFSYYTTYGVTTTTCLPYQGVQLTCPDLCANQNTSATEDLTFVTGGYQCVQNNIAQMQAWLNAGTPMAIQISLTEQFYDFGVATLASTTVYPYDSGVAGDSVVIGNHAMEIVGYGVLNGVNYWKLKNSWGVTWGDNGYLMIEQGFGGIESQACTTNLICPSSSRFATSSVKQTKQTRDDAVMSSTDFVLPATFFGVLVPGTYTIGAAAAANAPVSLDCQSSASSVFAFVIGGALSFNANVLIINGPCLVNWNVNGAVVIAAGFTVDGAITATGAITVGAGSTLVGCASTVGAITFGVGGSIQCGWKKPQNSTTSSSSSSPLSSPGGKAAAVLSHPLVLEAANFAAESLLVLPLAQGGFGCIPYVNNSASATGSGSLVSVQLLGGDQQVVSGLQLHVVFSFKAVDSRCAGASGTYDSTVLLDPSGTLTLMDIHSAAAAVTTGCTSPQLSGATNNAKLGGSFIILLIGALITMLSVV